MYQKKKEVMQLVRVIEDENVFGEIHDRMVRDGAITIRKDGGIFTVTDSEALLDEEDGRRLHVSFPTLHHRQAFCQQLETYHVEEIFVLYAP